MSAPEDVKRAFREMLEDGHEDSLSWHAVLSAYVERTERELSNERSDHGCAISAIQDERDRAEAAEAKLSQFAPLIDKLRIAVVRFECSSDGAQLQADVVLAIEAFPARESEGT